MLVFCPKVTLTTFVSIQVLTQVKYSEPCVVLFYVPGFSLMSDPIASRALQDGPLVLNPHPFFARIPINGSIYAQRIVFVVNPPAEAGSNSIHF
jgi:hypothetical protein